ncbi:MAG: hypothetical protein NC180_09820 [Muribaculaceae bacterium]|nr:hypothetical protein [Roseburia sp.]MCM1431826.1 hypothetical protein [Muribaculaceae bacterium]MCM1493507.1 hypothetical protein [Muribaculaceae bacterium]
MTKILEIRDRMIRFYGKYETYLFPVVKFILAFLIFSTINANIGYMERISTLTVALVLSLVCAVFPVYAMIWFVVLIVLADLYALSLEAAVTALVLFAVLLLVYFRFSPKDGIAALLTPVCFHFHIPYVMPLVTGLLREVYSVIAVVCGTVIYFFLDGIKRNEGALVAVETGEEAVSSKFSICVGQIVNNKEMYLVLAIFVVTATVVYVVRRLEVDHAWTLAIISGVLIELAGLFVGYLVLNISQKTLWLLIGNLISLLIAFLLEFLFMNLDYDRTERVQFEDDEYYYYVKAVPKKLVATREVKVKHFGNTSNMGRRIERTKQTLNDEQEATSRKVIARELDIDENLLK